MEEDHKLTILKGRLDGKQRNRLKKLLDMFYTPSELAEELGFNKDQVYMVYIPLGCPHDRDIRRHILINGKNFKTWYLGVYQKAKVNENETFCKTCRKAVKIINPESKKKTDMTYILSVCPNCGRKLSKIVDCNKRKND